MVADRQLANLSASAASIGSRESEDLCGSQVWSYIQGRLDMVRDWSLGD